MHRQYAGARSVAHGQFSGAAIGKHMGMQVAMLRANAVATLASIRSNTCSIHIAGIAAHDLHIWPMQRAS